MTGPEPRIVPPAEARLCGYTLVDQDGEQQPCNRPATSWRWYQDVVHEDCLDVACDWHENEGGRRLHAAAEQREAVLALCDEYDAYAAALDAAPKANLGHEYDAKRTATVARDVAAAFRARVTS